MAPAKVVIVTGASRGIGKAIVQLLAKPLQNCNVVAIARSRQPLLDLQQQNPERVAILDGDLSDITLAQRGVELAIKTWSRVDGLVINHGALQPLEKIADADVGEWKRAFDINVFSAIALIRAALPSLRESKGRIVLTSSGASIKGTSTWGAYSAGKAALNSLARTLAEEEPDVVSIAIRPGVVDTGMQATLAENYGKMNDKDANRFKKLREEGKMLRPEQPGNVIGRLVLDAGGELSGEFINWDDEKLSRFQDL